jgi:hypothetical protein
MMEGKDPVAIGRIAVELVVAKDGEVRDVISDEIFEALIDFAGRCPEARTLDLGIVSCGTAHPAFPTLLQRAAKRIEDRNGTVVVWVGSSELRELPCLPAAVTVSFGVLPGAPADTVDVLTARFQDRGAVPANCREVARVSLSVRPDRVDDGNAAPRGGCPILEQGAVFADLRGNLYACHRHLTEGVPIAAGLGDAPDKVGREIGRLRRLLRLDQRHIASPVCAGCLLGLAEVTGEGLAAYWEARDEEAPIASLSERIHIFREVAPMPHRAVRIDFGCGQSKTPGFIGIDRFPLAGVDIACDLDKGIPLSDDSVDYLLASHSLEHLADLPSVMKEIFRVCRDRAIVTIVAPYDATGLNRANPYHKQAFNEHTARFFTAQGNAFGLPREDFDFPHAPDWPLGRSDNSDWTADLRPLHVEYFYFPPYRGLDEAAKRALRSHLSDVCDQMLTHLVVVKSPIADDELRVLAQSAAFVEPLALKIRRMSEKDVGAPDLFAALPGVADRLAAVEEQIRGIVPELVAYRKLINPIVTLVRHLVRAPIDHAHSMGAEFQPLLEASLLTGGVTKGHRLTLSTFLTVHNPRVYPVVARDMQIDGIELAVTAILAPGSAQPLLTLDLYDAHTNEILRAGSLVAADSDLAKPVRVGFVPLLISGQKQIRIRIAGAPGAEHFGVRVFEWRRWGLRHMRSRGDAMLFGRLSGTRAPRPPTSIR